MAQTRAEVTMTLKRGESLLLALGIPMVLLGFFSLVDVLPRPDDTIDSVAFLAPGVLALAVMSTALVGLAIATGFEREYGVLKRLGTTPLGRPRLLGAKTIAIIVVEVVQVAVLGVEALLLGWRPNGGGLALAGLAMLLATVGFAGLGLLMAGRLAGLTTLAAANGLYLVLLLLSGMLIPLDNLPGPVAVVSKLLPSGALTQVMRDSLSGSTGSLTSWLVLAAWAVIGPVAASVSFRWE
ncbi:MAG: ABC transporter permease [Acidimicrobiales bacterium]